MKNVPAGDFIDRGAWGVEVVLTLMAMKLAQPAEIVLLRGNHECEALAKVYGFQRELEHKYPSQGRKKAATLLRKFSTFFSSLPVAAVIGGKTLVVHGGLWRRPNPERKSGKRKKKAQTRCQEKEVDSNGTAKPDVPIFKSASFQLGTLEDLRKATKGGQNPGYAHRKHVVASDVLWSDPQVTDCHMNTLHELDKRFFEFPVELL